MRQACVPAGRLLGLVHGDGPAVCGADADLDWVAQELAQDILLKARASWVAMRQQGICKKCGVSGVPPGGVP